jgi:hypothetical protein
MSVAITNAGINPFGNNRTKQDERIRQLEEQVRELREEVRHLRSRPMEPTMIGPGCGPYDRPPFGPEFR